MPGTRRQNQTAEKPTEQQVVNTQVSEQGPLVPLLSTRTLTTASNQNTSSQDVPFSAAASDILSLISNEITPISEDGKVIILSMVKDTQLIIDQKDQTISQMQSNITKPGNKVFELGNQTDEVNQYERRDTLSVSGPMLPLEDPNENTSELIVNFIKYNLHINLTPSIINIAHRLGDRQTQKVTRPIIVKLRSKHEKKYIMNACLTIRPKLYIKESLTPKRQSLFKILWDIRKDHRDLFQQCYKQDRKICVKLKMST